jgi:hypothetical protein
MSQRVGRGMTTKTEYIRDSSRLLLAGGDLSVSNPVRIEKQSWWNGLTSFSNTTLSDRSP